MSRTPVSKLLELKTIVESARWSLLDAVVMANELYDELARAEAVSVDDRGLLDPEPNHEDYVPGTDNGDCE